MILGTIIMPTSEWIDVQWFTILVTFEITPPTWTIAFVYAQLGTIYLTIHDYELV